MRRNILKAGGIVIKKEDGKIFVLLVHRPMFDDWTFPKGHVDEGELVSEAALREVKEESDVDCQVVKELDPFIYFDSKNDVCNVEFFLMKPISFGNNLDNECDEIAWIEIDKVSEKLTYDNLKEYFTSIKSSLMI